MTRLQKVSKLKKQMTKVASQLIGQTERIPSSATISPKKIDMANKHMQSGKSMLSMTKGGASIASIDSMNPYMSINQKLPQKDIKALSKRDAEKVLSKHLDSHQYYNPIQNKIEEEEEAKNDIAKAHKSMHSTFYTQKSDD